MNPFKEGENLIGNAMALVGAIFYALLITKMRKEKKTHNIGDVLWFLFFGSLILAPFAIHAGLGQLTSVGIYVLLLGFISTGLAYLLYNLALEELEAEIGSIIATIITPLVSIALAVLIIHEGLSINTLIGEGLLIVAGLYLEIHNKLQKE